MNVSITPELKKFINKKIKSGMYQSASEVVREGLRLLTERDRRNQHNEYLKREIQIGWEAAERGEFLTPEESEADMKKFREEFFRRKKDA